MEILAIIAVAVIAVAFMFWRYHVLARDFAKLAGMYALELHRGRVLTDRAEKAETAAAWTGKQLDALLVIPQPPHGDGATVIPRMFISVDGKEA